MVSWLHNQYERVFILILNNAFDSFESKLKWTLYLCIQIYAIWIFKVSAFNSAVFIFAIVRYGSVSTYTTPAH